jgi:hypothetical protein
VFTDAGFVAHAKHHSEPNALVILTGARPANIGAQRLPLAVNFPPAFALRHPDVTHRARDCTCSERKQSPQI